MAKKAFAVVLMMAGFSLFTPEKAFGGGLGGFIKDVGNFAGSVVGAPLKIVGNVVGGDVGKAVEDLGEAASGIVKGATGAVGEGVEAAEKGIQHVAGEMDKIVDDVVGDTSITVGVAVDSRGGVKGYNPVTGQTMEAQPAQSAASNQDLASLDEFKKTLSGEYVLWHRLDDAAGIERFLPRMPLPGDPCLDCPKLSAPTSSGDIRSGAGSFFAARTDPNGREGLRLHAGIDYHAVPGDPIYAPMDGTQVRIGRTESGLPLIEITAPSGLRAKVLYVEPTPEMRMANSLSRKGVQVPVVRGKLIGYARDIQATYGKSTPNHVHLTLELPDGRRISPDKKNVTTDARR